MIFAKRERNPILGTKPLFGDRDTKSFGRTGFSSESFTGIYNSSSFRVRIISCMNGIVIFGKRVDEENGKKVFYF